MRTRQTGSVKAMGPTVWPWGCELPSQDWTLPCDEYLEKGTCSDTYENDKACSQCFSPRMMAHTHICIKVASRLLASSREKNIRKNGQSNCLISIDILNIQHLQRSAGCHTWTALSLHRKRWALAGIRRCCRSRHGDLHLPGCHNGL